MENAREKTAAVVLAAGKGKRMNSDIPKQYMMLREKPVIYYALKAFEDSFIDEIILVTEQGEEAYCREEIVERYHFTKVRKIVPGGAERYFSVANGLEAVSEDCAYIFIHDGARPFITEDIIERVYKDTEKWDACVVGMPVKDTIKQTDENGVILDTPDRSRIWQAQTPQVFSVPLIVEAFQRQLSQDCRRVTDDSMIVENQMGVKVHMTEGGYTNIKITTPEDLAVAEAILTQYKK